MTRLQRLFFICITLALARAMPIYRQSNRGTISGTVTDASGAVVANVKVTATEISTNTRYSTLTSAAGTYNLPQVLVGTYNVTVSATGFQTSRQAGVVVQINTPSVVDVKLSLGDVTETATVSADVPTVQSTSSDISGNVTPRRVGELPL